jgi:hypothetical protein
MDTLTIMNEPFTFTQYRPLLPRQLVDDAKRCGTWLSEQELEAWHRVFENEEQDLSDGQLLRIAPEVRRQLVNRGRETCVLVAIGGAGEHVGQDGEAFATWSDSEGRPPQHVPLPDDLPLS